LNPDRAFGEGRRMQFAELDLSPLLFLQTVADSVLLGEDFNKLEKLKIEFCSKECTQQQICFKKREGVKTKSQFTTLRSSEKDRIPILSDG
jgi:hypothetical protein